MTFVDQSQTQLRLVVSLTGVQSSTLTECVKMRGVGIYEIQEGTSSFRIIKIWLQHGEFIMQSLYYILKGGLMSRMLMELSLKNFKWKICIGYLEEK